MDQPVASVHSDAHFARIASSQSFNLQYRPFAAFMASYFPLLGREKFPLSPMRDGAAKTNHSPGLARGQQSSQGEYARLILLD